MEVRRSKTKFYEPFKWGAGSKVFTCSWSDFFIDEADGWRDEAWKVIRQTPYLTYQILTKRPENIRKRLPHDWRLNFEHVWLGVSVETQEQDWRMSELLKIDAPVHFVSAEPLLEEIAIYDWLVPQHNGSHVINKRCIDWVIVGGESGPGKRTFDADWARSIREQCEQAGTAFFMKQMDKVRPIPEDLLIREFPRA